MTNPQPNQGVQPKAASLTTAQHRYLSRAVERLDNPSSKTGVWERVRGGRALPALEALERLGFIDFDIDPIRTDAYLKWFEVRATEAGRAALAESQPQ